MPAINSLKAELRQLLIDANGGPCMVLEKMATELPQDSPRLSDVHLLQRRLRDANLKRIQGVLGNEQLQLEYNRITYDLLQLINQLELTDFQTGQAGPSAYSKGQPMLGHVLYRIPRQMAVQQETRCMIRVAHTKEQIAEKIQLDRHVGLEAIRISEVMQVQLLDHSGGMRFNIRSLNSPEQFIDRDTYTEWQFFVTPLVQGRHPLMIKVAVIEQVKGKERLREEVLEEMIAVSASVPQQKGEEVFKSAGIQFGLANTPWWVSEGPGTSPADLNGPHPPQKARSWFTSSPSWVRYAALALALLLVVNVSLAAVMPYRYEYAYVRYLQDKEEDYRHFIQKYQGRTATGAQNLVEKAYFFKAEAVSPQDSTYKMASYDEYLAKYEITERNYDRVETATWKSAAFSGDAQRYREYLSQFPDGRREKALLKIAHLENTPSAYLDYFQEFSNGQFANQLRSEIIGKTDRWVATIRQTQNLEELEALKKLVPNWEEDPRIRKLNETLLGNLQSE